ncbi:cell envelope integrity protein TolA [Bradyrhizobium ontarionense]|uniref:Cell envelope integrity protein TolA n=1 Tax=Bradyrhizobium ontarionense TaxID=2898149 RepID=A0ABY3R2Q0_9BRAD|nr:cell envelope integrity protein TolA [Bradyrhizobium sp. A19]UFZ01406.1 cell envelope integrity protein TolA [Bradyrhizobium sp. A19]
MTFSDLTRFVRSRKGTVLSVALHVLVLCWGLFSFSARSMVVPPEDLVPVDVISEDNTSKAKAGALTGKKEATKLLADKIGEKKPTEDIVGKVDPKPVTETDAAPTPQPKPEKPVEKRPDPPKPVEKQPDPPKPVAETKPEPPKPAPAEKPKPEEKKPDAFNPDQIANVLNKEKAKQPAKPQQAAAPPEPPKHKSERKFDVEKMANLINQKDPTRQSVTGTELNANAQAGNMRGMAEDNSASWGAMFRSQVDRCWKPPYSSVDAKPVVLFNIRLRRDGSLEGAPVPVGATDTPFLRAYQESALRAIVACQPYNLPPAFFDEWKYFQPAFNADDRRG